MMVIWHVICKFFGGTHDTDFETCLQSIVFQMHKEMMHETSIDEESKVVTFMQQMIPHHENAVNMAKSLMKTDMDAVDGVEDLDGILLDIINVQNFQIHQFRNYLNPEGNLLEGSTSVPGARMVRELDETTCTGSELNICMSLDYFASETGYYNLDRGDFEDTSGSSPDITVKIGQTITFDQTDSTNWYHPVGFAYRPDGAHGDDWGADENAEVEGLGELLYKIDGEATTCEDAGDTGLDCYEPEFFYPYGDWQAKIYAAELTITPDVAAASLGGVIYYFCHIHSKMSGKIIILNEDGSEYSNGTEEQELYPPVTQDAHDVTCGTTGTAPYADGGNMACDMQFFGGTHDTDFETCLQSIDCQMYKEMMHETSIDEESNVVTFMQQMIPHHENAVNMAKLLLKTDMDAVDGVEDLEGILFGIINVQNFQVHQFRNYLNPLGKLLESSETQSPTPAPTEFVCTDDHKFRHQDKKKKSCKWIGSKGKRSKKLCKKNNVFSACKIVCGRCCADDLTRTFAAKEAERTCGWLWSESRKREQCTRPKVNAICAASCGRCCSNDKEFTFDINGDAKSCKWFNKKQRAKKYCKKEPSIAEACQKACDSCEDYTIPITDSPTPSPTKSSTKAPVKVPSAGGDDD